MSTSTGGSSSNERSQAATQPTTRPTMAPPTATVTKLTAAPPRSERAADAYRRHRQSIGRERRGVVHQALALEDDHQPSRQVELSGDRCGGDRVRRRHDGAEGDGDRPPELRGERHHHRRDGQRGHEDESDCQEADRPDVAPQLAWRQEVRRRKEDRRQEQDEHQVRDRARRGDASRSSTNPRPSPATTIRIGYGTPIRAASRVTAATTASSRRMSSISSTAAKRRAGPPGARCDPQTCRMGHA